MPVSGWSLPVHPRQELGKVHDGVLIYSDIIHNVSFHPLAVKFPKILPSNWGVI
jgi:hypothetical protein